MKCLLFLILALPLTASLTRLKPPLDHPLIFNGQFLPPDSQEEDEEKYPVDDDADDADDAQCYEDQLKYDLIYRKNWNKMQANRYITLKNPPEYIVVLDGGLHCHSKADCMNVVRREEFSNLGEDCKLRENFYIGGDGNVYEGRGWNIAPYWYLHGIRNLSLTVKFMGSHDSQLPSRDALRAFKSLLVSGVWMGTLSPRYEIVSIRQLSNTDTHLGKSLHGNVEKWAGWVSDESPASKWEYQQPDLLNFVFRREWNATEPTTAHKKTDLPVTYVLVNNVDKPCLSREECIFRVRSLQQSQMRDYGDLLDNFYIGEDGNVYEGRGWDFLPQWHVEGLRNSYVSVSFLGTFDSKIPADRAISSFKHLILTGVRLGKLSPYYELTSLRLVYGDRVFLGDALHSYVQKWTPWAKRFDIQSTEGRMTAKLVPLITRSDNSPKSAVPTAKFKPTLPIAFIILSDGGDKCFHVKDCMSKVVSEKRTYGYGNLDSFYVGSDGIVYEGRGWENLPPLYFKKLRRSYITINFLGTFNDSMPNNITLQAFHSFIKLGIDLGKISPSYQIYSLRHVYNDSSFLGDALSKYAEGQPQWLRETEFEDDEDVESWNLLPVVYYDAWNATFQNEKFVSINSSILYVLVGGIGDRCFSLAECTRQIREQEYRGIDVCGSFADHFYIGDDGNIYKGLGWLEYPPDTSNNKKETAVSVRFFGQFHKDIPSRLAISAFNALLRYGLNAGKLSEDYKIMSYRQLCNCTDELGEAFQQEMESMDHYSDETIPSIATESLPYVPFMTVPNVRKKYRSISSISGASALTSVEYIVISDGRDRCFDREKCLSQVNDLPSVKDNFENFFIGEDGRSYEAKGWHASIYSEYFCPNCTMVFIGFLGKFQDDLPSSNAIRALNYLLESGIRWGKINPEYKLVSIRQLCSNLSLIGDSLNEAARKWKNWRKQISITDDCTPFNNELVARHEWSARNPTYNYQEAYYRPTYFSSIFILNEGPDCSTKNECTAMSRRAYDRGDESVNFFIGGDGNVYEGLGWEWSRKNSRYMRIYDMPNQRRSVSLLVVFIGDFNMDVPLDASIMAFRKLIVRKGLETGRLHSSYTLSGSITGTHGDVITNALRQL
ncbi:uncharacterized protein LOC124162274 [Ischnura elegans]|uniref:uncharacterized protein LOC124162274 n=1 Tax=Ischnura elegans TaxID=197161 RepID=UPI001ED8B641|nr:uncharacterized protein LOC124162274 [Ischnura elegans]